MTAHLELDFALAVGNLDLAVTVNMDITFTALFGPSGSGKTTTLDVIAGLRRPVTGGVVFAGDRLCGDRIWVAPEKRRVGYVFQDARLFPQMTVEKNLTYGRPRRECRFKYGDAIEVLGLGPLLARRPVSLSGGEKQRVALGRALLAEPRLLLMDEPLAALDLPARMRLLVYLRSVHEAFDLPILYVSHDLASVVNFTDSMILLEQGRVEATGPPLTALARAEGGSAEGLVENTFKGVVETRNAAAGTLTVAVGESCFTTLDTGEQVGQPVVFTFPASEVILLADRPGKISTRNIFPGTVKRVESSGLRRLVFIDIGGGGMAVEVVPVTIEDLNLVPGQSIHAVIKASALRLLT